MNNLDETLPDDLKDFCIPFGLGNGQYFKSCAHLIVEKNSLGGEKLMDEKIKELEEKVADLEKTISEKDAEVEKLKAEAELVDDLKKKIKDLEKENEDLKAKIDELEKKLKSYYYPPQGKNPAKESEAQSVDALKKRIKELEDENKKLKAKVDELENKLKKYYPPKGYYPAKEDLEKKDKELKELKEKVSQSQKEIKDLRDELKLKDKRIEELEDKIREKELAERTKERIDQIISETGFEFSDERLEKVKSEIRDLSDDEFKDYVDSMVDTVLASIPAEVVKIMKDIQEKEEDLSLASVIQKAYETYNKSVTKEPADLTGAKSLSSLNQDKDESLYEKYKKL